MRADRWHLFYFFYKSAWLAGALAVYVSMLLPLFRANDWWIRWFDFPRLQIFILGAALIALQLFWGTHHGWWRRFLLLTLLITIAYQAYRIFPYKPLSPVQVQNAAAAEKGVVIRIVTANVLMYNRQAEKYLQVLGEENPDIILTTEADQWWTDQLRPLDPIYPYQVKFPLANTYGMVLHSRFPLIHPSVRFLIEPMVPSIHTYIEVPGDGRFYFIGLHPRPPGPLGSEDTVERDAELIISGRIAKKIQLPVMVLGDLNDVAWSRTTKLFQKISSLLDPRIGRGMFNTFHADYFLIRFPLDHIFHSSHFKVVEMRRLGHIGSDHFPFYAALCFTGRIDSGQQPAAPSHEEWKEADEILEEAEKKPSTVIGK